MTSSSTDLRATGRRVILREAGALEALAGALDDRFAEALGLLMAAKGRVIVSGMGKSGHIARKIAATFASTGTPAHFVHPAEASHGDLGMVAEGDVLIVLSNSGETTELADLLAHAKRFGIPMIAITSRAGSTVMRQATVGLLLPDVPEACEKGIVPTTSTTMTLALGDALAIALMEHRAFTPEHFRMFHPGGKLGARLLKVRDLMHDAPPLVPANLAMGEVLLEITQRGFGVVGVTDASGDLAGIITDGDLRRHLDGLMQHKAAEVMTPDPRTIGPDALAGEALALMNDRKITCLLVTAEGSRRAIGILHVHDCLRAGVA
jgi:arabinose-5-phosphate isomerase